MAKVGDQNGTYDAGPAKLSLMAEGPFFEILKRTYLSGSDLERVVRRVLVFVAITWAPLLALAFRDGQLTQDVRVPFLFDVDVHARFLVAMPLLFFAELGMHRWFPTVLQKFHERALIPVDQQPRFYAAIISTRRLASSRWIEMAIVTIVAAVWLSGVWTDSMALEVDTWYGHLDNNEFVASGAGRWFGLVSIPIFQFLLLRWYFRLFVWWQLLWRISRLDLKLQPLHPDRAGGLAFLSQLSMAVAFAPLLMAQGALLAGMIANQIFFAGAKLPEFKMELIAVVVFTVLLAIGPLIFFAPSLFRARHAGIGAYGALATRFAEEFDHKWLRGTSPEGEALVSSGDIQSLADLGNGYATLNGMRLVPFTTLTVMPLVAATLAPVAPLLLTMFSLEDLLSRLVGVFF